MPIYEYECRKCEEKFELLHLGREEQEAVRCPKCQALEVERIISLFSSGAAQSAAAGCGPSGST